MTEKEIITLNRKQLDFLIRCIARGMSMTHRNPLRASHEIEGYIQNTLKGLTEKQLYDVITKEEPRGQSVTYKGIPCTARTCVTRLNRLTEENEQLKKELGKFKEWEKHSGDVTREELDRVFKMSIYEIAEAFEYYKERIKKLEKELEMND